MAAPNPIAWANHAFSHGVVRVPLRIARCPGCERDPAHPTARACDRIGCPIKHLGSHHGEGQ